MTNPISGSKNAGLGAGATNPPKPGSAPDPKLGARPGSPAPLPVTGGPIRVVVVDDSAFMRKAIADMLSSDPGIQVVASGCNGEQAIELAKKHRPDVITLDVEMPVMDGFTALKRIRRDCPEPRPAVLVCSSLTKAGSHEALKALCAGAADFIAKEASGYSANATGIRDELLAKVKAIAGGSRRPLGTKPLPTATTPGTVSDKIPKLSASQFDAVLIGISTGGPPALEQLFAVLPASLPVPVIVAQHMPPVFTRALAERLDGVGPMTVVEGEMGMPLIPAAGYILPGGKQGRLRGMGKQLRLEISDEPRDALYRPCVNELFGSAARALGGRVLAIVMTGMGDDGRIGAEQLKAKGAVILAQKAESCVVYGMPKAIVDGNLATAALSPEELGRAIGQLAGASALTGSGSSAPGTGDGQGGGALAA